MYVTEEPQLTACSSTVSELLALHPSERALGMLIMLLTLCVVVAKALRPHSHSPHLFRSSSRLCSTVDDTYSYPNFSFTLHEVEGEVSERNKRCRRGTLVTPHGNVETPSFIFCATKAAMKAVSPSQLHEENTQIILSNTYHLMLTPGSEIIEKMGGLQKFTNWRGPMLTDSGGYQIFSMGHGSVSSEIKGNRNLESMGFVQTLICIDEAGATFRSYVDGSIHHLTPERSIEIQRQLGADLIVVLDECTPFNVDKDYTEASMHRSHRWAVRSLEEFKRTASGKQALYGIVQGGVYDDLRKVSCAFVNDHQFFGLAIGGSLGADRQSMHNIVAFTRAMLRNDRPVHLLGIGGVRDIFHGVRQGIDTFDCVHPTRLGRHGGALVPASFWSEAPWAESTDGVDAVSSGESSEKKWKVNQKKMIKRSIREHTNVDKSPMRNDPRPLVAECECYTCKNFSRAYLHHLFKAKESLGGTLVTTHNIHFMNKLMGDIREGIATGTLDEVEKKYVHPELSDNNNSTDREE